MLYLVILVRDFNMNTITSDNLCENTINLATTNEASSNSSKQFEKWKNDLNDFEYSAPYSLKEVDDRLLKRNTFPESNSSFDDLKIEVKNLKREIKSLKQNQSIYDHRITQIEINNSEERFSENKGKQNDASKLIFAMWQAQLTPFNFET
ncbi:hypothetical protein H5410_004158 [Solanum commersonii]|uniref:Uncharacterized protein n=1 Tax=Solanum commersonii TaxID=4109 RepID=A0A9J6B6Z2_SOLCO|nr:hypothetical protein H5410_004158 [Solanum commersonii]